jgi:imidazolonepropionase-like amidohydrolase
MILAGKPDFIKVILLHSEDYEQRKAKQGYGEGIDPKLLPQIVARAHAAGLTVSAHVDSAGDYRAALKAGVDEMAHLPGYYIALTENVLTYALSPEDAKETARRGVHVTPTASLSDYMRDPLEQEKTKANQVRNLKLLKDAGVQFGIGTDSYGTDSLREALCLSRLGVWDNREMLKMWCETTPRNIFRKRKIGYLREGYAASFLVLDKNPLDDFENVQSVRLRFKQGNLLTPAPKSP